MSQSESFDAFYARTSWNVTNQVHTLTGEDPLADHAIREAYAKAYQQWYEVSTYPDPEAWVLDVANDAYQRRLAEAAALSDPSPATGHDPLSWPGMFRSARPTAQPVPDPDATLDPRLAGPASLEAGGRALADASPLSTAVAGGCSGWRCSALAAPVPPAVFRPRFAGGEPQAGWRAARPKPVQALTARRPTGSRPRPTATSVETPDAATQRWSGLANRTPCPPRCSASVLSPRRRQADPDCRG